MLESSHSPTNCQGPCCLQNGASPAKFGLFMKIRRTLSPRPLHPARVLPTHSTQWPLLFLLEAANHVCHADRQRTPAPRSGSQVRHTADGHQPLDAARPAGPLSPRAAARGTVLCHQGQLASGDHQDDGCRPGQLRRGVGGRDEPGAGGQSQAVADHLCQHRQTGRVDRARRQEGRDADDVRQRVRTGQDCRARAGRGCWCGSRSPTSARSSN